jgi:hypothetical protein
MVDKAIWGREAILDLAAILVTKVYKAQLDLVVRRGRVVLLATRAQLVKWAQLGLLVPRVPPELVERRVIQAQLDLSVIGGLSVLRVQLVTKDPMAQLAQLVFKVREVILVILVTKVRWAQLVKLADKVREAKREILATKVFKAHPDNKAKLEDRDSPVLLV